MDSNVDFNFHFNIDFGVELHRRGDQVFNQTFFWWNIVETLR